MMAGSMRRRSFLGMDITRARPFFSGVGDALWSMSSTVERSEANSRLDRVSCIVVKQRGDGRPGGSAGTMTNPHSEQTAASNSCFSCCHVFGPFHRTMTLRAYSSAQVN